MVSDLDECSVRIYEFVGCVLDAPIAVGFCDTPQGVSVLNGVLHRFTGERACSFACVCDG